MSLNTIEEIIEDLRAGKMVVIMDDEDRENEGDLIMAASKANAQDINFMARYGRGLICLTLTKERCEQLRLPLMVQHTNDKHATNFTVSIEASKGVTTGISAADRAVPIQAAVAPEARPTDLVQPGHIFPLMAQPGGVLTRAGHTEAGCDLARLAGYEPASVIVEILNEDGTMARRPDLEIFARQHGLKIGTIADLIHYRLENEKTVERIAEIKLPNEFGEFRLITYQDQIDQKLHFALLYGTITPESPMLVRVHMHNFISDVLHAERKDNSWPLRSAMRKVAEEGAGVIVILETPYEPRDLVLRMYNYQLQDEGIDLPEQDKDPNLRTYGIGAQILADVGVSKMRVLSSPKILHGIAGFGLEIVEYVPCD